MIVTVQTDRVAVIVGSPVSVGADGALPTGAAGAGLAGLPVAGAAGADGDAPGLAAGPPWLTPADAASPLPPGGSVTGAGEGEGLAALATGSAADGDGEAEGDPATEPPGTACVVDGGGLSSARVVPALSPTTSTATAPAYRNERILIDKNTPPSVRELPDSFLNLLSPTNAGKDGG